MGSVFNPVLPYSGWIHNGAFYPGRMIRIQGSLPVKGRGFTINLQTGPNGGNGDVGLHCNLRLPQRTLHLNSKLMGEWGREEKQDNATFAPGQPFEIIILSQGHTYKIALNGRHFAEFNHRVAVDRILFMCVEGDVTLSVIAFEGGTGGGYAPPLSAPLHAPSAPPIGFVDPSYGAPPAPIYPQVSGYGGHNSGPGGGNTGQYPPPSGGAGANPGYYAPPPAYPSSQYPPQSPFAPPPPQSPYGPPPPQSPYAPPPPQSPYGPPPPQSHYAPPPPQSPYGPPPPQSHYAPPSPHHPPFYPPPPGAGDGGSGHPAYPSSAPPNQKDGEKKEGMSLKAKLGAAAAVGAGGLLAVKVLKGKKSKKLLKFGIPLAGVGLGGYALKKGLEHKK